MQIVTETLFSLNHMKKELMLGFCLFAFFFNSRNTARTSYTYTFLAKVMWAISVISRLKKLIYKFATNSSIKGNVDNFCYR